MGPMHYDSQAATQWLFSALKVAHLVSTSPCLSQHNFHFIEQGPWGGTKSSLETFQRHWKSILFAEILTDISHKYHGDWESN